MEDTLRYFFSAVFQGFSALITLGIMFYLYYLDRQTRKIDEIEKDLMIFKPDRLSPGSEEKIKYYIENGIFIYTKKYLLPPLVEANPNHQIVVGIKRYDSIVKQKIILSDSLLVLFKIATLTLVVSIISLFMIGYYSWLSTILFFIGIVIIALCLVFFNKLFAFSKTIINTPS